MIKIILFYLGCSFKCLTCDTIPICLSCNTSAHRDIIPSCNCIIGYFEINQTECPSIY